MDNQLRWKKYFLRIKLESDLILIDGFRNETNGTSQNGKKQFGTEGV